MLVEATSLILAGLNRYILSLDGSPLGDADVAILGNAAQIDHPDVGPTLENQVLLTVVNLAEETTTKNGRTAFTENNRLVVRHRPVHLNLFLVFAANFADYRTALTRLGQIVTYFQGQKNFDPAGFPGVVPTLPPEAELSLSMELVTLDLEQTNNLWGSLGGHQLPFAAYWARLLVLQDNRPAAGGGIVREMEFQLQGSTTGAGSA